MQQATATGSAPVTPVPRFAGTKRYFNPKEAAEYLRIGYSSLSIHRMKGTGPRFIKWAGNVRYDIQELDRWMAERTVTPAPRESDAARVTKTARGGKRRGRPARKEGK